MSCANVCEDSEIKYVGNGSQVLFTFPFTYMEQSDVYVELYNETTRRWEKQTAWSFQNATTIKFDTAPPAPTESGLANVKIRRCTELDPLSATFYPGSAIRAQDLNDNFFQLRLAIEEGKCFVPQWLFDYLDKYYWNKGEDTTYSTDDWDAEADDKHVPTTGAVDKQLDELKDYVDEQDDKKIDKTSIVTLEDQKLGRWTSTSNLNSDDNVPSTAATSERHDAFWQDNVPVNVPAYRTPGRRWVDTGDVRDKVWDQQNQVWVDITNTGPQGPKGDEGTYSTIVSDNPPTKRNNNESLQNGDVWFNSNTGELFVYYQDGNSNQWVAAVSGIQGPAGNDGADGNLCTIGDTPPSNPQVGDTWFNTKCPVGLYAWDGTQWVGTSIAGPVGPKGDKGDKGDQGDAATVDVGTTTTGAPGTDAEVVNSGTTSEAIFDFTIPQGEKGDKGDAGNSGVVNDTPPSDPDIGDLWFNTKCPSGLYAWDGTQWVGTSTPGPAGAQGNAGVVSDNPPSTPNLGDLWFDTKCPSGLYVWLVTLII